MALRSIRNALAIPFQGIGEAGRDLAAGSRIILTALTRGAIYAIRYGWRAATGTSYTTDSDATGDASEGDSQASESTPNLTKGKTPKGKKSTKKRSAPSAGDRLETIGLGCLTAAIALAVAGGTAATAISIAWPHIAPHMPLILIGLALAWFITAQFVAPARDDHPAPGEESPAATGHATHDDHENEADTGEQPNPTNLTHRISRHVIAAVADAEGAGLKGVHINQLVKTLSDEGEGIHNFPDVTSLREVLEACGFPTDRNVKIRGAGPTWGVRVDALTHALGAPLRDALTLLDQPPTHTPQPTPDQPHPEDPTNTPHPTPATTTEPTPPQRHLTAVPNHSPETAA
ncbi:hypothetical protein [Streptomyces sp. NBRC 109706]|uniref:hypothetical protein n=1 Tax=Streptomyces sp. NBRC 109706 TaxID=1550035 RepID=UPI0007807208|nr:hypothetical protein [Streptomyces sp. NBRC 109706]